MQWRLHRAFDVEGLPKGQPRPRAYTSGRHAKVYDPGTADAWKAAVMMAFNLNDPRALLGPVRLSVTFFMPRQKQDSQKLRPAPIEKPDIVNLIKGTMDALTKSGAWVDDSQVVELLTQKVYADSGRPGALVQIFKMVEA